MTPRILLTLLAASALLASACKSTSSSPKDEGTQIPETTGAAPDSSGPDATSRSYASAELPRLPEAQATSALAIVATKEGIARVDLNGDGRGELLVRGGNVSHCVMDHRTDVLWFARSDEGSEESDWYGLDMDRDGAVPVEIVKGVKGGHAIELQYPDRARFGTRGALDGNASAMLELGDAPALSVFLGCDGDAGWSCYEDEDFTILNEELQQTNASIEAASLLNVAWLKEVSARYKIPAQEQDSNKEGPRITAVPEDRCLEAPEDCGKSMLVSGTPYLRVVTFNDRGDYYHEAQQFYDSEESVFFDPLIVGKKSKAPFADDDYESPTDGLLSPGSEAYASAGMLVSFTRGKIAEFEHVCGWSEPTSSFQNPWL